MIKKLLILTLLVSNIVIGASETSPYTIRLAQEADLTELCLLNYQVTLEYFVPIFEKEYPELNITKESDCLQEWSREDAIDFKKAINHTDTYVLYVALHNTHIVGFILFSKFEAHTLINLIMIDAKHRGQGLGKQLLKIALTYFDDVTDCTLIVLKKNYAAITLYEYLNFVPLHSIPEYYSDYYRNNSYRYLCYKKSLA